ncbi:MAG: hypothetical protein U1E36_01865 [Rickettsiales bacterium]
MPLTIMALGGLFSMKAYDVYNGTTALSAMLAGEAVAAGEEAPSEAEKAAKDAQATPEEKVADAKEPSPTDGIKKADEKPAEKKPAESGSVEDSPVNAKGTEMASLDKPAEISGEEKPQYSQVELDILQSLAKRRDKLDQWENDIKMKENLLNATEQRINDKIGEIKSLQGSVSKLLAQYNDHEDSKIKSLVKIYENMKPKDAAQIFDEMEMPILLEVIDKMSERKAAPILAQMTPHKAKEVTVQLAEQRKLMVKQQQALDQMN